MKTIKIGLNFILTNFIIFLLLSIWTNFYIKNKVLSFFLSVGLTALIYCIINQITSKNELKVQEKKQNLNKLDKFKNFFNSLSKNEFKSFLEKIFINKISEKNSNLLYNNEALIINALNKNLSKNDIACFCKTSKALNLKKIVIFNFENNEKIINFCNSIENFEIEFAEIQNLFTLVEERKISYDNIIKFKSKVKINLKQLLILIFSRKNAKMFFLFGILNLITSYLTIFKFYYYISTTIFFILALICILRPKEKSKSSIIF